MFDLVGLAAINFDFIKLVDHDVPDTEVAIRDVDYSFTYDVRSLGGSVVNTAIGLAKMGLKVCVIGKVGDDDLGSEAIRALRSHGVEPLVVRERGLTGRAYILVDRRGRRLIRVFPGVNDLIRPDDVLKHIDIIRSSRMLHSSTFVCSLSTSSLQAQVELYRRSSILRSLSVGSIYARLYRESARARDMIDELLGNVDVLIGNRDELEAMLGEPIDDVVWSLFDKYGISVISITLGPDGAKTYSREGGVIKVPAVRVERVVDTTGAGDAYAAGFLAGLLRGRSLSTCTTWGVLMASRCVQTLGGVSYDVPRELLESVRS